MASHHLNNSLCTVKIIISDTIWEYQFFYHLDMTSKFYLGFYISCFTAVVELLKVFHLADTAGVKISGLG